MSGRILNLVSFTWSAGWASLWLSRPDAVITETDPFLLAFVGRWLQLRHRCRWVVYLQDIYPDIAVAVGKIREGVVSRILRRLLFGIYRRADRVIVLSRDMERTCMDYGIPSEKLIVLPNWADTRQVRPRKSANEFRRQYGLEDKFVAMYSGNLGLAHPLTPLLDAAERLQTQDRIRFVFVGDGAQRKSLEADCRRRGLTNVLFAPYQPLETLSQSLSAADVHLVTMQPEATGCLMPSKLYGILASSTAVIALAHPQSELSRIVTDHEVGFACNLIDAEAVAERVAFVVNFLADRPDECRSLGENARRLAETQFDRRLMTGRFHRLLGEVLAPVSSRMDEVVLAFPQAR